MSIGSFAKYSGTGQTMPTTSFAVLDMGSEVVDADNIVSESSGTFTPSEAGYYIILAEGKFISTSNGRQNFLWHIQKNSTDIAGGQGSGYCRNNGNDKVYVRAGAIIYFNGTSDTFSINHKRDNGSGTPAGTYSFTHLKLIKLGESGMPFSRYETPTSALLSGNTPTAISGWDVETETDTSVIELQAGGTDIRLKEANRPYLIVYCLNHLDSASVRTTRVSDITLEGTRIGHSCGYAYQRDNNNQHAIPFGMALVYPTSINQDLNVRCWGYDDDAATLWGTFSDGSWNLSYVAGLAGVQVIALPSSTDIAIFNDTTGGDTISGTGTVDLTVIDATIKSGTNFTKDSDTSVTIPSATDVLAWGSVMVERTASSGTRNTAATRWEKEGIDQAHTEYGDYLRGEQGSQDTKNMVLSSSFIDSVSAGDTLQYEKFNPGTNAGANDETSWGGAFFIDLETLPGGTDNSVSVGLLTAQFFLQNATTQTSSSIDVSVGLLNSNFDLKTTSISIVKNDTINVAILSANFTLHSVTVIASTAISINVGVLNSNFTLHSVTIQIDDPTNVNINVNTLSTNFKIQDSVVRIVQIAKPQIGKPFQGVFEIHSVVVQLKKVSRVDTFDLRIKFYSPKVVISQGVNINISTTELGFNIFPVTVIRGEGIIVKPDELKSSINSYFFNVKIVENNTINVNTLNANFNLLASTVSIDANVSINVNVLNAVLFIQEPNVQIDNRISVNTLNAVYVLRSAVVSIVKNELINVTTLNSNFQLQPTSVSAAKNVFVSVNKLNSNFDLQPIIISVSQNAEIDFLIAQFNILPALITISNPDNIVNVSTLTSVFNILSPYVITNINRYCKPIIIEYIVPDKMKINFIETSPYKIEHIKKDYKINQIIIIEYKTEFNSENYSVKIDCKK